MSNSDFESLLEDFELLESWEDRYRYIIDLGKDLDPYPEPYRTEEYRVLGCASQVWFYPSITKGEDETIFNFKGDSDAMIVKGLIKILLIIYNNKPISQLQDIDPFIQIKMLGLQEHLSSQRSNGLKSMILKIQETLRQHC